MNRTIMVTAALAIFASPAAAQQADQFASGLSAAVEGLGESVAQGMGAGQSLFVTATGEAALGAAPVDAYVLDIEGQSSSAAEAARLRDTRLGAIKTLAVKYGVTLDVGASAYSRDADMKTPPYRRVIPQPVPTPANSTPDAPAAQRPFKARTTVRFRAADSSRMAMFLDGLAAAGVDASFSGPERANSNIFLAMSQAVGFAPLEPVDPATWDRASQAAIAEARRQASVLASAAGRQLAEARQIMLLTRSVQGGAAKVTVAVRYGLVPSR